MHQDLSIENRQMAVSVLQMLRPHRLEGASKIRVGRPFDGGYVMVDRFRDVAAAYSLGINDDVSWDLEIAARGIPVFQYDHTIEGLPEAHPLFHWEKKCIHGAVDEASNTTTLAHVLHEHGHDDRGELILKCDIEGAEWTALRFTPTHLFERFQQMVMEVHCMSFLTDPAHAVGVHETVAKLTAAHKVVHVHANNYAPWLVVGGIPLPEVLELTFVRNDMGRFVVSDEVFPTAIDMPNHAESADFFLGRFEFA